MIIVLTTIPKKANAEKLAKSLVEKQLAACVNIIKIESVYRWKGKIEKQPEYLLLIKTSDKAYHHLEEYIKQNHPYKLPEIVCLPITKGYRKYLDWITKSR